MNTARTLFPGAMGPEGFISCFDHLIPDALLRRKLILKGGPGVGKSTFMRRIHAALCEHGESSTLYFCSGDPDSLDAVAVPHAGLLILDGTAPHIVDPAIPGARDSIINLGVCLNEAAMRPRLPHIRACMADHAAAIRRARACLNAACALEQDAAAVIAACVDSSRMERMVRTLIGAVLCSSAKTEDVPSVRPVITDAVTPKGELCLLGDAASQRIIRLTGHAGMDLTPAIKALSRAALAAGYSVEEHLSAALPGRLLHLSIPALHILVTTGELLPSEQTFDFAACIPASALLRHECALEQLLSAAKQQRRQAVSALAQAKQLHDELETFYVPNMDFARWEQILGETLASLT
ncbi:MAG: hypothetical protein IKK34_01040 [Clostridia bacterium]|nr:hypothetical protein [Clostridia bacterium]